MAGDEHARTPLSGGLPLGRYGGVQVVAHWSVLAILALLSVLLAGDVLPAWEPHRAPAAYWSVGAATAVGFLVTLLAHELAHAVAARHYGLPARRITLWLLGGLTELGDEPPSPRADLVIAAAGPLTSLGLGGGLAGLTVLAAHGLPAVALAWLAGVNVLLGLFNLLPGTPLDGGRLLRAAVWAHTRNRRRGVEAAARAGRVTGFGLIVLGVLELLAGGAASGIWLALIGWFIASAASAEGYADLAGDLRGLTVHDVMTVPPATVPSWWTVADFLGNLGHAHPADGAFALVDVDGRPTGVLTVAALTTVPPDARATTRLRECRGAVRPLTVTADARLDQLLVPLRLHGGIAVVVEETRVVGTVSLRSVEAAAERSRLTRVSGTG